jgi:hypothetical protein
MRRILPISILFLFLLSLVASASGDEQKCPVPRCGQIKSIPVITISLAVGSTGKEAKRVTYAPPPGWYVRAHRVEIKERTGLASFTVNTLPQNWSYLSEDQVRETYKGLLELAAKAQNIALGTKLAAEEERTMAEVRKARSSHHALVVEATVKGEGLFRSGGSLYMTVIADLVFVGTPEDIVRSAKEHE